MPSTTTILAARSCHHLWQGSGDLSIKTFRGGQAHYHVAGGQHLVDDGCYFLLNAGQDYTVSIDATHPVESFCLFFAPGFAEEVAYSLATPDEQLLDNPTLPAVTPLCFYERTYPHDRLLSPELSHLRTTYLAGHLEQAQATGWLDEQCQRIMHRLLARHAQTVREVVALPYVRAATRAELYQRVYRARDYLVATLDQPLSLQQLAAIAYLSPSHFLRTFKQIFQQTPHQYLLQARLERAAHWLRTTERSVTEISLAVGFESLGTFSWRFRRHFGVAPASYRRTRTHHAAKK